MAVHAGCCKCPERGLSQVCMRTNCEKVEKEGIVKKAVQSCRNRWTYF